VLGFGVAFGLFGFVDGFGFAPGSVFGAVEPVGGAVVLPVGGCAGLPVGGVPVLPVGGVEGDVWPGVADPPADPAPRADPDPPPGAACATTQVAQKRTTDSKVSFIADILKASSIEFSVPFNAGEPAGLKDP
jgi:hypothetical protein